MHIVAEIPDKFVKDFEFGSNTMEDRQEIYKCVRKGVRLPKGHGRLIDAGEYENSIRKHYFDNSTVIRCTEIALDNAPTVIEADKEEQDISNETKIINTLHRIANTSQQVYLGDYGAER